jgi:hypothetical protein
MHAERRELKVVQVRDLRREWRTADNGCAPCVREPQLHLYGADETTESEYGNRAYHQATSRQRWLAVMTLPALIRIGRVHRTTTVLGRTVLQSLPDSWPGSAMIYTPPCPSCGEPMRLLGTERSLRAEKLHVFECKPCQLSYVTTDPRPPRLIYSN